MPVFSRRLLFALPLLAVALLCVLGAQRRHPIHLSITDIDYNAQSRSLEITHRLFIDDLEVALSRMAPQLGPLRLTTPREHPKADSLIRLYVQVHFGLKADGQTPQRTWIGREADRESIWVYEEARLANPPVTLELLCTFIQEVHDDQRAIVNVTSGSTRRSTMLYRAKPSGELKVGG